jgi:hypothetical protein
MESAFFRNKAVKLLKTLDGSLEADKTKGTGIQCLEAARTCPIKDSDRGLAADHACLVGAVAYERAQISDSRKWLCDGLLRLALAKDPVAKAPAIGCGLAPVFSQDPCRLQQSLQVEIGTRADYSGVLKRRSAPHRMRLGPVAEGVETKAGKCNKTGG